MSLQDAIRVIDSCSGFTDQSTPAGEAWNVIQSELAALNMLVSKHTSTGDETGNKIEVKFGRDSVTEHQSRWEPTVDSSTNS